jgi:hypothetical protein
MSGKTKTMKTKDGRTIPIIEPENKFIKRRPTKKEMQEDRAKNRPSRNITGDRAKQRKRKKLRSDMLKASLAGFGLGRKLGPGVMTEREQEQVLEGLLGEPISRLTGGQAKIDMNKNNKIDAEDFKMLRGEEPQKLSRGGGIAIKGTKFTGTF